MVPAGKYRDGELNILPERIRNAITDMGVELPDHEQLYHLSEDPDELNNLLQDNGHYFAIRDRMHRKLTNWFIENSGRYCLKPV